jgi:hypothetical protein
VFFATMVVGVLIGDGIGARGDSRASRDSAAQAPAC